MTLSASDIGDAFLETVQLITGTDNDREAMAVLNGWKADPSPMTESRAGKLLHLARTILALELERTGDGECGDMAAPVLLTEAMALEYERRAQAEREDGGSCTIDHVLPTVAIVMANGDEWFFQEHEARKLLDDVPDNLSPEDYILASAQSR
jgi:hypothetical protein